MTSIPLWTLPLAGLALLALAMAGAWLRQRRTGDAGIVDLLWAASFTPLALAYAAAAPGWGPRRWLVAALVCGWSLRLAWHLRRRLAGEGREDGRYRALRAELGERFQPWILVFFQIQALLAVLLSLAFLPAMSAAHRGWRALDLAALLLWLVAVAGESIADRQLARWRADPAKAGRTCRAGLWRHSRHPNYFFEWLHWLVYPLLALGFPYGAFAWLAPAVLLFLVLKVTGIPPTERQAIASRGSDYLDYQRETNAFFPGPVRRSLGERSPHTLLR